MKINDTSRLSQMLSYQKYNRAQSKAYGSTESARDGVSISQEALDRARETQGEAGTDRAERIASVKQAIDNGTYSVEPNAVVRKIMAAYGDL